MAVKLEIRSRKRGAVNVGCIFGGLVLLVVVYGAFKFVPVKVAIAEIRDTTTSEATLGSMKKDDLIRYAIMQKVNENHIAFKEKEIEIERRTDEIHIKFTIKVPVELIGGKTYIVSELIDVRRPMF